MSWIKSLNPFKKQEEAAKPATTDELKLAAEKFKAGEMPKLPKELENSPEAKGMMGMFYRKWKDPAFLKQIRALAAHMQREGVNVKDMKAVQEWLQKNEDGIKAGKFNEAPADPNKGEPFVKTGPDVGRNDPCTCGSGKKYKKCCGAK